MAAYATQFVIQHSDRVSEINLPNWTSPSPAPIAGIASVIDGDTIEVHAQRIRINGTDAPESRQHCDGQGLRISVRAPGR